MATSRAVSLALLLAFAPSARGSEPPVPLKYDLALDATITATTALTVVLLSLQQPALLPATCHWCTPPGLDVGVRNALAWKDHERTADVISTVLDAALPVSAVGYLLLSANGAGDVNAGLVDTLLVTEAVAGALLVNQVVKLLVGRKRPYAFFEHDVGYARSEDNLSFYSGHSSFAASVVAATVTVAAMRGYPGAGIFAGVGFTMVACVGYLRIAADQHWLTDNLVGFAVGGLLGFAIPRLFHSPAPPPTGAPAPAIRTPPLGFAFAF